MASYEQINGVWSVRFRAVEDGKEKNKRLSGFKKKKDAEKAYDAFMDAYKKSPIYDNELTFGELWEKYKIHISSRLKESTCMDTETVMRVHILPKFANRKVCRITKKDVLEWQNSLTEQKYSHKYKTNVRNYLQAVLKFGVRYYDIHENVVAKVEPFRNIEGKKEMLFWTLAEYKQFIACVDKEMWHAFFGLLYYSGVRKGEALALTWADFKDNKITISKSKTKKTIGKPYAISTPKTKTSYRTISLPQALCLELNKYRGEGKQSDFMFGGEIPLAEQTVTNNLVKYCAKADVKKIRVHDFRHSHVSYLISKGVNIVAIARRLGHADIEQTYNTYSHLMPESEEQILKVLDES